MRYEKSNLREIRFPLGGIGTGSVSLAGNGRLCDWEIFNRPAKGSMNGYSHLAVCAKSAGRCYPKVLNGDLTSDLTGQYEKKINAGYGHGASASTMCGFPHFRDLVFDGEFPIARLRFSDPDFPGRITLTAFNPLIPGDADASGIPAAFIELSYENTTENEVELLGALSVQNPFEIGENIAADGSVTLRNAAVTDPDAIGYGDMTIVATGESCGAQEYWYRGGWQDGIVMFWNEFQGGALAPRHYDTPAAKDTASVYATVKVAPKATKRLRFVISWSIPNQYNYWEPAKDENGNDITWKNHYATRFASSKESAAYASTHFSSLLQRTESFCRAMFSQTLDPAVIDAAASTLAVLKSPTVLRLEDGSFYGWEGVHEEIGSCEGTCQHVWNYAYALAFLFPELERSIHDLTLRYCMREDGGTVFRLKLPYGYRENPMRPCVDGQMGMVIRIYRDWKMTGDTQNLKEKWPAVKRMVAFAWSETNADAWDRDKDGVLEGRQHHTLDMELFGPHAWLEGFYLAALKAASEMAAFLGDPEEALYRKLFDYGYQWTKENLFQGEYFIQKLDLSDRNAIARFPLTDEYWNEEQKEIKYQIGEGCEIDQLCGQWHATLCGIGNVFDEIQMDTALRALYRNNVKPTMRGFTNPWRIFALNDESGAVICDYPIGAHKPAIPIPYCEECMNGFEYQLAGMLISRGMVEEGLALVQAVRARYNGENRNPYNEFECGSNYARSMASFALLPILSGFSFDMPHETVGFDPVLSGNFRSFWSLGQGYGSFEKSASRVVLSVVEGALPLRAIRLPFVREVLSVVVDGTPISCNFVNETLHFNRTKVQKELAITYR